jgi:hypothetical protein
MSISGKLNTLSDFVLGFAMGAIGLYNHETSPVLPKSLEMNFIYSQYDDVKIFRKFGTIFFFKLHFGNKRAIECGLHIL